MRDNDGNTALMLAEIAHYGGGSPEVVISIVDALKENGEIIL